MDDARDARWGLEAREWWRAGDSWGPCSCHGGAHLSAERKAELEAICAAIGQAGKGITACDEGPGTIGSRFENVGVVNTEENRRSYRQMLFETPGANEYLSAAILDPETLYQKSTTNGKLFPEVLSDLGIVPGVKPHLKVYALPGQSGATVMQGLDSLAVRLQEYKDAGCKFAKWRSPLEIDVAAGQPSELTIETNMKDLARYALICQDVGLVPIVEPDISLKGDHDLETAVRVNVKVQSMLFKSMLDHGVYMEGALLKSNMVNPGKKCKTKYTVDELAVANLQVFRRCFPTAMVSANFLSGGQSLEDAKGPPRRHQQAQVRQGSVELVLLLVRCASNATLRALPRQVRASAQGDGRLVHRRARKGWRRSAPTASSTLAKARKATTSPSNPSDTNERVDRPTTRIFILFKHHHSISVSSSARAARARLRRRSEKVLSRSVARRELYPRHSSDVDVVARTRSRRGDVSVPLAMLTAPARATARGGARRAHSRSRRHRRVVRASACEDSSARPTPRTRRDFVRDALLLSTLGVARGARAREDGDGDGDVHRPRRRRRACSSPARTAASGTRRRSRSRRKGRRLSWRVEASIRLSARRASCERRWARTPRR